MTPSQYWRKLDERGVVVTRDYVYKILSGDRPYPPYPVVAASAVVTDVPVQWFFAPDVPTGGPSEFIRRLNLPQGQSTDQQT